MGALPPCTQRPDLSSAGAESQVGSPGVSLSKLSTAGKQTRRGHRAWTGKASAGHTGWSRTPALRSRAAWPQATHQTRCASASGSMNRGLKHTPHRLLGRLNTESAKGLTSIAFRPDTGRAVCRGPGRRSPRPGPWRTLSQRATPLPCGGVPALGARQQLGRDQKPCLGK